MEQGINKADSKKDVENCQGSSKPESSGKNAHQSLKAKSRFVKRSQPSKLKIKKNKGFKQIQGKHQKRKNKATVVEREISRDGNVCSKKQTPEDSKQKRTTNEQLKEKSQQVDKRNEDSQNMSTSDKPFTEQSHHSQNSKEKNNESNKSKKEQKNIGEHGKSNKGANDRKNKNEKGSTKKVTLNEGRKEKLGGLIFMCSAKTKPDCFHYRIMGVSSGKKDVVLGVKRGLKLFLYDFDLKLLYGIYQATSSGGMRLEPKAFNGSFPAQVRFSIEKDCFPLPESIFKKAIKENYDEKNKFKTELTVRQVRKLTELFRPVTIHSTLLPLHTSSKVVMQDREACDGFKGRKSHLRRESSDQDPYANSHGKGYHVLLHEREQRDLFLTEKDYRAYGLQGDRINLTPPSYLNPIREPFKRDHGREHLHQLGSIYREDIPSQSHVERFLSDPLYLNKREHQAYGQDVGDYRYGSSSRDPYSLPSYGAELSSSSLSRAGNLPGRETIQDGLYSAYAAEALPGYNQRQHYHRAQPVSMPAPVSSRYAFAGPLHSYP